MTLKMPTGYKNTNKNTFEQTSVSLGLTAKIEYLKEMDAERQKY